MFPGLIVVLLLWLPASQQQSALGVPSVGPASAAPTPAVLPGEAATG